MSVAHQSTPILPIRPRNPVPAGIVALVLLSASGCADASSDPTAVLMAEETQAALQVTGDLPSVPELGERYGVAESTTREGVDRWIESWGAPERDGSRLRNEAYALVAPELAAAMPDPALAGFLRDVDVAVTAAEALGRERPLPVPVGARVQDARALVDDAFRETERGDRETGLRRALAAADRLRSLMPERVALRLVERAEGALRRNAGPDSYTPTELRRADRLIRGARQALDSGDLARAVRRAFYACQILGVSVR